MNPTALLQRRLELMNAGPVSPEGIREIVALELMTRIMQKEDLDKERPAEQPRKYFLTLYSQCLQIVSGDDIEDVFGEGS